MKNYNYWQDELDDELNWLRNQTYYHGTSSNIRIRDGRLLPSAETGTIREQTLANVYVTTSLGSALRYAYKAIDKFGGKPVVYKVEPDWDTIRLRLDCEYICDYADIISIVE